MSKKLPDGATIETVPFSGTLKKLLAEYQRQFAVQSQEAINSEARDRGYPDGTTFDFQKQLWQFGAGTRPGGPLAEKPRDS